MEAVWRETISGLLVLQVEFRRCDMASDVGRWLQRVEMKREKYKNSSVLGWVCGN